MGKYIFNCYWIREAFRIRQPLAIDFVKSSNNVSAAIYGRNGSGKSSIVDAWEWLLNWKIEGLNKEGVSESDYPHKSCSGINCSITVDFQHPKINSLKALFNSSRITTPITTGQYDEFKALCNYPNYLRYSDLQDFVFRTKTEKYRYIAKFFGLEVLADYQAELQASITRLEIKLTQINQALLTSKNKLKGVTGSEVLDENSLVTAINKVAGKHQFPVITELKYANVTKTLFDSLIHENPITKKIADWSRFSRTFNSFYPFPKVLQPAQDLEAAFSNLKNDEGKIKDLFLSSLYELTIKVIPQLPDKNKCPVCDTLFEGDLMKHITTKHDSLSVLHRNKINYEAKKRFLEGQIESVKKKIASIHGEGNSEITDNLKTLFDSVNFINSNLSIISDAIKNELKDTIEISICSEQVVKVIEEVRADEEKYRRIIADKLSSLQLDETTKNLAANYESLVILINESKLFLENSKKLLYLQDVIANSKTFFQELTKFIQLKIQDVFNSISTDVVEYFSFLEGQNSHIKNPQIKLTSDRNKAVELEIEFVTQKITPAFKVLSESQVNSFGLSIFLAATKYLNRDFKFIILDDIVNSFDSFKRPKVAQLIAQKFSDFQFLILTHDQVFFETIQRTFPTWQRYKFISWDFTSGPKYSLAKSYSEDIQESIDNDEPISAGQKLGRYLEWTFSLVNENLQTPIKYKVDNTYTLSESFEPLAKRFRDKLKASGKQHKLLLLIDQLSTNTIFRNYCAHWKDEASPYTSLEIEAIFKKWQEIEEIIYCTVCNSYVRLFISGDFENVICNCTAKNLKDNAYYA